MVALCLVSWKGKWKKISEYAVCLKRKRTENKRKSFIIILNRVYIYRYIWHHSPTSENQKKKKTRTTSGGEGKREKRREKERESSFSTYIGAKKRNRAVAFPAPKNSKINNKKQTQRRKPGGKKKTHQKSQM